jgi:methyl-accepting chemotaxis protein
MVLNNTSQSKRLNYYIDKKFQTSFIIKFCAIVALGSVMTIGILYLLSGQSTTVLMTNARTHVLPTSEYILPLIIQTVLIVLVMVGIGTIIQVLLISHKIAGPLYRLKEGFKKVKSGDFTIGLNLRQPDQLKDVANDFNETISHIKFKLQEVKKQEALLKESVDKFNEEALPDNVKNDLNKIRQTINDLNETIHYFQT